MKEGERHAAELKRLEGKRKELEEALMRLARDETEAEEVMELASLVERMEAEVETARSAAQMEKNDMKNDPMTAGDVAKAMAANRAAAERQLNELAKSMMKPGETFEKAYSRALDTDMGGAMLRTLEDATAVQTGQPTEADLYEARKRLSDG